MKERPIIFSAESVRAILDGRKTQTRRVVSNRVLDIRQDLEDRYHSVGSVGDGMSVRIESETDTYLAHAPHKIGDRLWVREAYQFDTCGCVHYKANQEGFDSNGQWKSPMFMPRSFSRLTLEIVDVRCERLQDISSGDCIAEGYDRMGFVGHDFAAAWDALNKKRGFGWDTNPYVWVLEFKLLKGDQ
jgi:hypothetical protein